LEFKITSSNNRASTCLKFNLGSTNVTRGRTDKKAEELGINVEDLIIDAISRHDPPEATKLRLKLVEDIWLNVRSTLGKVTPSRPPKRRIR
jgi:hypothetical protein